jgi:hypothetical protein
MTATEETPKVYHAFKNGRIVEIKPIQRVALALIRTALDKKYPKPQPPINATADLGEIANTADPDYIAELAAWEQKQRNRAQLHILRFVIVFDAAQIAADMAALEADRQRIADYLAEYGMEPSTFAEAEPDAALVAELDDSTQRLTWLYWVACAADAGEIVELLKAIADISNQEGTIRAAQATFPG